MITARAPHSSVHTAFCRPSHDPIDRLGKKLVLLLERLKQEEYSSSFIHIASMEQVHEQLRELESREQCGAELPLRGVSFAVKDNIDVAGWPTTAACPEFSYVPSRHSAVVERFLAAGAICVGKTNLDQFATGLVGTRSPYGIPRNPFNPGYIPGGSSSGSAVAVARGLVDFALGTDTAGSGRVPAAFNNIVGLKPSRGLISTRGVVPACRTLDCVSIFAHTCGDANALMEIAAGYDPVGPFSRDLQELTTGRTRSTSRYRVGVPRPDQLRFFGDPHTPLLFAEAVARIESLGCETVTIEFEPFTAAARLLYDGPWIAERFAAVGDFLRQNPEAGLPVTRQIIENGAGPSAVDLFRAQYQLQSLRQQAQTAWEQMDALLLPTAGTIYTIDQVQADPVRLNTDLGYYTNFVNLLDLCGVAVPAGFTPTGLPFGVTLLAPAGQDQVVLALGDRMHRAAGVTLGATGKAFPEYPPLPFPQDSVHIAVVGAHLSGQPLNHQLTATGGTLVRSCRTAACYRLFALAGTVPPKPGLLRVAEGEGAPIELEVWSLSREAFGGFVAAIPPPLGIGTVALEDGSSVKGFLCESHALTGARDITAFGGWRAFLAGEKT